ncbi:atrial natriuretic peptide receptor 1-like [Lampetra planeri]
MRMRREASLAPLAAVDLRLQAGAPPHVLLGPGCSYAARHVAPFAARWGTPLLTAGAATSGDHRQIGGSGGQTSGDHRQIGGSGGQTSGDLRQIGGSGGQTSGDHRQIGGSGGQTSGGDRQIGVSGVRDIVRDIRKLDSSSSHSSSSATGGGGVAGGDLGLVTRVGPSHGKLDSSSSSHSSSSSSHSSSSSSAATGGDLGLVTRVGPSHGKLGRFAASLHAHAGWSRRALVAYSDRVTDERPCFFAAGGLHGGLTAADGANVSAATMAFREEARVVELAGMLEEMRLRARVIYVCCSPRAFRRLLLVARVMGMTSGDFVFIHINLYAQRLRTSTPATG